MCDDDVAALVIDNGSGQIKAGFAGDDAPRNENYYLKNMSNTFRLIKAALDFDILLDLRDSLDPPP